jgi:hypothetical protein
MDYEGGEKLGYLFKFTAAQELFYNIEGYKLYIYI